MKLIDTRAKATTLRWMLILLGCFAQLLWLWCLFWFPKEWSDQHGYNQLAGLIFSSLAHLVIGSLLLAAAYAKMMTYAFAASVAAAPISHYIGASQEPPVCDIFFVAPALFILVFGLHESFSKPI
ncbi:MAG: hypothetical protein ABL974_23835 [Prosthecobacter sp.]